MLDTYAHEHRDCDFRNAKKFRTMHASRLCQVFMANYLTRKVVAYDEPSLHEYTADLDTSGVYIASLHGDDKTQLDELMNDLSSELKSLLVSHGVMVKSVQVQCIKHPDNRTARLFAIVKFKL